MSKTWYLWECVECGQVFENGYGDCPNEESGLETHATKRLAEFKQAPRAKRWFNKK